jgi:hypothetical protein
MSKIFYDHLIDLSAVEKEIKKNIKDPEERAEIYQLVDEIVHHRIVGCILDELPTSHHKEFLTKLSERPHDDSIFLYLKEKLSVDIEHFIRREMYDVGTEILQLIKPLEQKN